MARNTFQEAPRVTLESLLQDVRFGVRQLVRQPASSLVAVLTLGLGMGASAAVFSVIDATMLRPLPYPDPGQLVTIGVDLSKMNTVGDLQGGIELAERVLGYKVVLVEEGTPRSR